MFVVDSCAARWHPWNGSHCRESDKLCVCEWIWFLFWLAASSVRDKFQLNTGSLTALLVGLYKEWLQTRLMAHSGKLELPFGKKRDLHNFYCIINKCFSEITKENLLLYFWFWIWKRQMWKLNQNLFEILSSCSSRENFLLHPRADMFHLIGYACDYCYIQIINGFC